MADIYVPMLTDYLEMQYTSPAPLPERERERKTIAI